MRPWTWPASSGSARALEAGDRAGPGAAEPERQADRAEIKSPAPDRQRDDGFQR